MRVVERMYMEGGNMVSQEAEIGTTVLLLLPILSLYKAIVIGSQQPNPITSKKALPFRHHNRIKSVPLTINTRLELRSLHEFEKSNPTQPLTVAFY